MNKKFLSGILACALAAGSAFGVTACRDLGESGTGGTGGTGENQNVVKPGTVITDEALVREMIDAVSGAEIGGLTCSASLDMNITAEEKSSAKVTLEGSARLRGGMEADLFCAVENGSGEQRTTGYHLLFVRGDALYSASKEGTEGNKETFDALKAELKAEDPLVLGREEAETLQSVLNAPALLGIAGNLASVAEGVVTKTEGGYSLTYDVIAAAEGLLAGAEKLAETAETTAGMTVSALFAQPFVSDLFGKLLGGVTAKELYDLAAPLLPQEIVSLLPEADAKGDAFGYLTGLLRSGDFYASVTGGEEDWAAYKTFGEVPLETLAEALSGGTLEDLGLKELLHGWSGKLGEKLVGLAADLAGIGGTAKSGEAELTVTFSLDEQKKLLGFSAEGLIAGSLAPEAEEGESETVRAAETGETSLRASVKIEAAIVSSPELFDLSGCEYSEADGDRAQIPSA